MGRKKHRHTNYEEKYLALKYHFEDEVSVEDIATELGVTRSSVYSWLKRIEYRFENVERLKTKGRVRKRSRNAVLTDLPEWVKAEVLALIKEHPGMGALKLKQYFFRHHQVIVPQKRLYFFLRDEGILAARAKAGKTADEGAQRRFEYPAPLAAVQLDLLQLTLREGAKLYLATFLDDYSRFVLHARLLPVKTMDAVIKQLREVVKRHGIMDRLITDKGSEFVSWHGFTAFEEFLCQLDVELIASGPETPQNQGKVERWHQTLRQEFEALRGRFAYQSEAQLELDRFVNYYNYERPHQALGGLVPADRFFGIAEDLEKELASYHGGGRAHERIYFCCNIQGRRLVVSGPRRGEFNVYCSDPGTEGNGQGDE
jgi:transposase InsO family protein/predicted DNA-binding protein YlxM (UPF0122 family)